MVRGLGTGGLTPAEIDALVRSTVAAGRDLYALDRAAMAQIAPDVVLTQDLCRVCALPAGAVQQARTIVDRLAPGVAVDAVDAGAVVTRPGPRVVDGVEALAAHWHPAPAAAAGRRPALVRRVG